MNVEFLNFHEFGRTRYNLMKNAIYGNIFSFNVNEVSKSLRNIYHHLIEKFQPIITFYDQVRAKMSL